jgi:hypothetical protein
LFCSIRDQAMAMRLYAKYAKNRQSPSQAALTLGRIISRAWRVPAEGRHRHWRSVPLGAHVDGRQRPFG